MLSSALGRRSSITRRDRPTTVRSDSRGAAQAHGMRRFGRLELVFDRRHVQVDRGQVGPERVMQFARQARLFVVGHADQVARELRELLGARGDHRFEVFVVALEHVFGGDPPVEVAPRHAVEQDEHEDREHVDRHCGSHGQPVAAGRAFGALFEDTLGFADHRVRRGPDALRGPAVPGIGARRLQRGLAPVALVGQGPGVGASGASFLHQFAQAVDATELDRVAGRAAPSRS